MCLNTAEPLGKVLWDAVLLDEVSARELLGFDSKTGEPKHWPLPYSATPWNVELENLEKGHYELYVGSVDLSGYAQLEPRSLRKSGKNPVQCHRFKLG